MSVTRLRHWVRQGYIHSRKSTAWKQVVLWADADELARLRRLRDHPRQNRVAHYLAELIRPKEREPRASRVGGQENSKK